MKSNLTPRIRDAIPALFVFAGFMLATVAGTTMAYMNKKVQQGAQFRQSVTQAHAAIDSVVDQYVTLLDAGRAFVQSTQALDRYNFEAFAAGLSLRQRYPGFQGLGYAQRVLFSDKASFNESMKKGGEPGYEIVTGSIEGDMYPIKFIEPRDQRNALALGYDMFTEPTRREAMVRARDNNEVAATPALTLRQEVLADAQYGFLIYAPVYKRGIRTDSVLARREAISGFVYGAFRAKDLFNSLRGRFRDVGVEVEVLDDSATGEAAIFNTSDVNRRQNSISMPYEFAGHTWNVIYTPAASSISGQSVLDVDMLLVPVGGILAALLLSWFVYRENRANSNAFAADLARDKAENSLRLQTQLIEVAREPILILDGEGRIVTWNLGCEQLYKYSREEAVGHKSFDLLKTVIPMKLETFWQQLLTDGQISCELTHFAKGGERIIVEARLETFRTSDGIKILKSDWDIRDRKDAERQQNLLVRELTHRVKNLLAVVQSIVNNTIPATPANEQIRKVLVSRLHALSRAQDIVTRSNEEGADLLEMIRTQFDGQDDKVKITGVPIAANANFAQMFALVIHELATNAAKYGSLSAPGGCVEVGLDIIHEDEGDFLDLSWAEYGGPLVSPPQNKGFGSRLIMTALPVRRGQRPMAEFAPEGLRYRAIVPMSSVQLHTADNES